MAERKWGAIASGATFESLVTTIVFFEDPRAALFGRRGKDGGQDARSGDGTRVFQAKFHQDESAATAIRDAKSEIASIQLYRKPDHARYEQWRTVTDWRLVTNASFNPSDRQRWDQEVVPLFRAENIAADYWERRNLDGLLDKHPEIHRSFFEHETRAFLSPPEVREQFPTREPFLQRHELGEFVGREPEIEHVRSFLASEKLFLVLHGAGGIGKTRLLLEAAEELAGDGVWQFLWANIASMAATGSWFEGIVPERPTVLVVDEPPDEVLLRQLTEQLGVRVGRMSQWRVIVGVRSPKNPVLRFMFGPRMKRNVEVLPLGPLTQGAAETMCSDLIKTGVLSGMSEEIRSDICNKLSQQFERHPIWLTLAIHLLEERGDLSRVPTSSVDLATEYLKEIETKQDELPPAQMRELLRWISLVGTVNREDDNTIRLIGNAVPDADLAEIRRVIAMLVARRALSERGARARLVELKPDVLRDHVLRSWLSTDLGYGERRIVASEGAKSLIRAVTRAVFEGHLSNLGIATLVSVARTELLLRGEELEVPLLDEFFEAIQTGVDSLQAGQRLGLAKVLESIAPFRPLDTARIVRVLRLSHVADQSVEGILGVQVLGHTDVVLSLAWPMFCAATGAQSEEERTAVFSELCNLTRAEADLAPSLKRGLPNDGKRAAALVTRAIEGGPNFRSEYSTVAERTSEDVISAITREPADAGTKALLKAVVQPMLCVQRTQEWAENLSFVMQRFAIDSTHPDWGVRRRLQEQLRSVLLSDATPSSSKQALWDLLSESHRDVNEAYRHEEPAHGEFYELLLDDLTWARETLKQRRVTLDELSAARQLWRWHHVYEKDPQLKAVSGELEALYISDAVAAEFEALVDDEDWESREAREIAKADALIAAGDPGDIFGFVDRAVVFFGNDEGLRKVGTVAWGLGARAGSCLSVQTFIRESLKSPIPTGRSDFGAIAAASWIDAARREGPEKVHILVAEVLECCGGDEQKANLIIRVYGRIPRPSRLAPLTVQEHEFLRGQGGLFLKSKRLLPAFIGALAITLEYNWPGLQSVLKSLLDALKEEDALTMSMRALIDGIYWAVRGAREEDLPLDLGVWLLDRMVGLANLSSLGDHAEWDLDQIFAKIGCVPVAWLWDAVVLRVVMEAQDEGRIGRAFGYNARLSKYVRPLSEADRTGPAAASVAKMIDLVERGGAIGYHLPEILSDVDPEGIVVPDTIVGRIQTAKTGDDVRKFSRLSAAYGVGSPSWRKIAKAALLAKSAGTGSVEERTRTFVSLDGRGYRTWASKPGQVAAIFTSAVDRARKARDQEPDLDVRAFWDWKLARAEAELRDEEERAKEQRGE